MTITIYNSKLILLAGLNVINFLAMQTSHYLILLDYIVQIIYRIQLDMNFGALKQLLMPNHKFFAHNVHQTQLGSISNFDLNFLCWYSYFSQFMHQHIRKLENHQPKKV